MTTSPTQSAAVIPAGQPGGAAAPNSNPGTVPTPPPAPGTASTPPSVPQQATGAAATPGTTPVHVRLLAINDLHGQLGDSDAKIGADAVGGAATLAGYLNRERNADPAGTVLVSVGDAIGASPPESTLLDHKSTFAVLAAMGLNLATLGNHEFDRGFDSIMSLITGSQSLPQHRRARRAGRARARATHAGAAHVAHTARTAHRAHAARLPLAAHAQRAARRAHLSASAPAAKPDTAPWPGSPFPWVSANIVDKKTGKLVFPPYAIMDVNGVKVAFIGAVTADLKNVTMASGIPNIEATDPVAAINRFVPELQAQGVHTIVAFIHEGGDVNAKTGEVTGPVVDIAKNLDPDIDAVLSGHSHKEYALRVGGKVVTQGSAYGKALSEVDLQVDPKTDQVLSSSGRIIRNLEKDMQPDPVVGKLVGMFQAAVAPKTERVISILPGAVTRAPSPAGETAMGTLIAEAQRRFAGTELAFMNPGGIRQDLPEGGPVTWGKLFGVQPFANHVDRLEMSGAQVLATLEQMFPATGDPKILQVAGMRVWFDLTRPAGHRIVKVVTDDGRAIDAKRTYSVAASNFLQGGGDGFTTFRQAKLLADVGIDLDALVQYLQAGNPVPTAPIGRMNIVGGALPDTAH